MFKLLITIGAIYLLYKLLKNDKKNKATQSGAKSKTVASGEMVKDPICGTFVPKNNDIRVKIGDRVECFCSYECRDKFLKQIENESNTQSQDS
ncbi:MAG: transcriptional regulator [Desulfonauticus sp.]|nr:transcriptional regulator [Desulfonauticus sp.]